MSLPGAAERGASDSRSDSSGHDQRFPRSYRLTTRAQFREVYARGHRARSDSFTLFGLPNGLDRSRLGVTVTRKIGGAVKRNRAKRRLRELFRRNREELSPRMDIVINAHPAMVGSDYAGLELEFIQGMRRLARKARS